MIQGHIAVKITPCRLAKTNFQHAYSLIELLIVISLFSITIVGTLSAFHTFYYKLSGHITLQQLQQALTYGRSVAILHQQKVTVCPSYNQYSCDGSWNQGILVLAPNNDSRFFHSYIATNAILTLTQSGRTNNRVEIQANGMTYTNGHFSYKSLKATYIPQFNLYFNRALRNYVLRGGY